ncbi:MAG: hypothetical protein LBL81_01850 [Tannerella sp.]|jgi:V/A-type H+-transporting ATPase subunit E|nr:hypothetical protein [Tannerella sp.]
MDTKIQELTDKIYREGVEKGQDEARRIVEEANQQKQTIVGGAEAEAKQIIAEAKKEAAVLKKNTEAELKLYAAQSVEALKSEVANLLCGEICSANVKAAFADKAYMQKLILELAKGWASKQELVIQTAQASDLLKYFEANAKALLDKGLRIEQVAGKNASFTLAPADGSYKLMFGEEEFTNFFKDFLRPQLAGLLF